MKKKIILSLIMAFVLVGVLTGCKKEKEIEKGGIKGNAYKIGYLHIDENIDKIISNYDDFLEYFNTYTNHRYDGQGNISSSSCDEILNKYNEEYFDNKSLAVVYGAVGSGGLNVDLVYGMVDGNKVTVKYHIEHPDGAVTDDMSGFFLIVEVDKDVTKVDGEELED